MKLSWRRVFLLAVVMAFTISLVAATAIDEDAEEQEEVQGNGEQFDLIGEEEENQTSGLRGISRFLAQVKKAKSQTCKKYPTVCRAKSSPGPYCCKDKCVDLKSDRKNCGFCNNKCKYTETCCGGRCVNLAFDKRHCGRCGNKCNNGVYCIYGLCDYA